MRIALALAVVAIPFSATAQEAAASISGAVLDPRGAYISRMRVKLDSGIRNYEAQTDDSGVYRFSNLPAGAYTLTLDFAGLNAQIIRSIDLLEREHKRIPDVTLDFPSCGFSRDLILLRTETSFGRLSGRVAPPAKEVEVTLVCRTFRACASTKTDDKGRFSFEMLSAGAYGLNFRREGFYPENATGYEYTVNSGWESIYAPKELEQCPNGNCDPKLRPPRPIRYCE